MEEIHSERPEEKEPDQFFLSKLQEQTGFARNVLAKPEEDVWNEL